MVWNVKIVIGQPDAVPAHLVDQVFPDNDHLLAAVLNPDRENKAGHLELAYKPTSCTQDARSRVFCNTFVFMFYLHGLVVNTENGTLCLNSSVM